MWGDPGAAFMCGPEEFSACGESQYRPGFPERGGGSERGDEALLLLLGLKLRGGVLHRAGSSGGGAGKRARRAEKREGLREMGYEFDMPGVRGVEDVPIKVREVENGEVDGEGGEVGGEGKMGIFGFGEGKMGFCEVGWGFEGEEGRGEGEGGWGCNGERHYCCCWIE